MVCGIMCGLSLKRHAPCFLDPRPLRYVLHSVKPRMFPGMGRKGWASAADLVEELFQGE